MYQHPQPAQQRGYPQQGQSYLQQGQPPAPGASWDAARSMDSIFPPQGGRHFAAQPVSYSATIDSLQSPRMNYAPMQGRQGVPQVQGVSYQPQQQAYHQVPQQGMLQGQQGQQYYAHPQQQQQYSTGHIAMPSSATKKKGFLKMPQAVSLGVAFGLFFLGIVSFFL